MAVAANYSSKWQNVVAIGSESTFGTEAGTLQRLVCLDTPDIDPGLDTPKSIGSVGRGIIEPHSTDMVVGLSAPAVRLRARSDELLLYKILRVLLQTAGSIAGGGPYTTTFVNPTAQPANNLGLSLLGAPIAGVSSEGEASYGNVCPKLALAGADNGEPVEIAAEFLGQSFVGTTVAAPGSTLLGAKQHMFFDCAFTLAGTTIFPFSFNLELAVAHARAYANSQTTRDFILGMWADKLELTIPIKGTSAHQGFGQLGRYLAKTPQPVIVEMGAAGAAGYFKYTADMIPGKPTRGTSDGGIETLTIPMTSGLNSTGPTTRTITLVTAASPT